jgi:chromosome partitioning protein
MAKIVAFSTNKGGVLKTSLAINVAGSLATQGKKILIIDMDNQGNIATSFGQDPDQYETTWI